MKFRVIDNKTGKEADTWNIALHEEWAQGLIYCDMEGFAITEDGSLVLMDECGHVVYCDAKRFKVVFEDERPHGECETHKKGIWIEDDEWGNCHCSKCGETNNHQPNFCENCGSDMRKEGDEK